MICAEKGQRSPVAISPGGSSLLFLEDEEKSFLLANIWNSAATHDGDGFCRSVIARPPPPPPLGAEALPLFMSPRPKRKTKLNSLRALCCNASPLESRMPHSLTEVEINESKKDLEQMLQISLLLRYLLLPPVLDLLHLENDAGITKCPKGHEQSWTDAREQKRSKGTAVTLAQDLTTEL